MKIKSLLTRISVYGILAALTTTVAQAGFQAPTAERPPAGALPTGTDLYSGGTLIDTVSLVINWALGFLGIVILLIMLFAGFQYATAGGDEKKTEDARKMIINAVIGLIIIFFAFVLSNAILGFVFGQGTGAAVILPY